MAVGVGWTRICDGSSGIGTSASLAVGLSTSTPNYGDSVTVTATPTNITPTSYNFLIPQRDGTLLSVSQVSNVYMWVVDAIGTLNFSVVATDGTDSPSASAIITSINSYILDTYTTANAAFSVRKLRSAYAGHCMTVRRDSDNATSNIGFVNDLLDVASILTFVGSGSGYVTTWYDQSTTASNATQTVAANQPLIVSEGQLNLLNDLPAIHFGQSRWVYNGFTITSRTVNTLFGCWRKSSNEIQYVQLLGWASDYALQCGGSPATMTVETAGGYMTASLNNYRANQLTVLLGAAGAGRVRANGTQLNTGTTSATSVLQRIGVNTYSTSRYLLGEFQELITFPDDQTANFTAIETNQLNYFNL